MKCIIGFLLFLLVPLFGSGQALDELLQNVEKNNPRLIALQKWLEAEETKAKTGIYPENPEVSFQYLFGNPAAIGNQHEFGVMQSFRLPGFYLSKSEIQQLTFKQMQALADVDKREVMHSASSVYFHLVMLHQKADALKARQTNANVLVELFTEGFEAGEISRPLLDKARIHAIGVEHELLAALSEIKVQIHLLEQISGVVSLANLTFSYPADREIPLLERILTDLPENNPHLMMAQLNIRQREMEITHNRIANLPSFSAGYRSEAILDQSLQGFHVGITIPLWQNRNMVRHARLQHDWAKAHFTQQESELVAQISGMYHQLIALQTSYRQMKDVLEQEQVLPGNLELLQSGQISFSEYLVNADLVWEARKQYFQTEYEFFVLLSKLRSMF
ncbi:MAG TPA: TolC family protein [Bacteroidales bacterium]|nr:TolC family protein [Bacteroidales bacterium]